MGDTAGDAVRCSFLGVVCGLSESVRCRFDLDTVGVMLNALVRWSNRGGGGAVPRPDVSAVRQCAHLCPSPSASEVQV